MSAAGASTTTGTFHLCLTEGTTADLTPDQFLAALQEAFGVRVLAPDFDSPLIRLLMDLEDLQAGQVALTAFAGLIREAVDDGPDPVEYLADAAPVPP